MSYVLVQDFKGGIDSRKARVTTPAGSLYDLVDGHISRGGEIEQRKAFVQKYILPAGTFGLASVGGSLYTFGSVSDPGVPSGVTYSRLQKGALSMTDIVDVEVFDGKLYVVATYSDGNNYHFYDGSEVVDWSLQSNAMMGFATNAEAATYFGAQIDATEDFTASVVTRTITITGVSSDDYTCTATSKNGATVTVTKVRPGQKFSESKISGSTGSNIGNMINFSGLSAAFDGVSNSSRSGGAGINVSVSGYGNTIGKNWSSAKYISKAVIYSPNDVPMLASGTTKAKLRGSNDGVSYTDISAEVDITTSQGASFSIASNTTTKYTYHVIDVSGNGSNSIGVTEVEFYEGTAEQTAQFTVEFPSTYDATDSFDINITDDDANSVAHVGYSGLPSGNAISCYTLGSKMYIAASSVLYYSGVNYPTLWDATPSSGDTGAGFINMATEVGSEDLTGISVYNKSLAVFARDTVQIWSVEADDSQNIQLQVMRNSGALAPKTVVPYGGTDVYYLSESGIRSLRARDSSVDTAAVSDVGTAIDTRVRPEISSLSAAQIAKSIGIIEPVDARYWLSLGDYMWVFSYFPGSKISAWSRYYMGGSVDAITTIDDRVYIRQGQYVKLYGGDDGETYDDTVVKVYLPFIDSSKPATWKSLTGIDVAASGKWSISVLTDPNDETIKSNLLTVEGITYSKPDAFMTGDTTHFAPELVSVGEGFHALYSMAVHYTESGE